jgi:small Trp-rich protein
MYLLLLGLGLMALKWLEIGPVAAWDWWWVLSPFAGAVVWWWVADVSGLTRRQADAREEARKEARIDEGRRRMGLPPRKRK